MRTVTEVGRYTFIVYCNKKKITLNSKTLTGQWRTVMTVQHYDMTENIRVGEEHCDETSKCMAINK